MVADNPLLKIPYRDEDGNEKATYPNDWNDEQRKNYADYESQRIKDNRIIWGIQLILFGSLLSIPFWCLFLN